MCSLTGFSQQHKWGKNAKTFKVSGIVTQTFSYCGGVAPSREMLDKLGTPIAFPGKMFYVREGEINNSKNKIIKAFTADSTGKFCFRLEPGIYAIILQEQLDTVKVTDYAKSDQQVDEFCLNNWWKTPYYLLTIKRSNVTELKFNFFHRCFLATDNPCISYRGVLPQ